MHLAALIQDLAVILGVAAVVTLIFRRLRQPVVLGYLVAGMIVGPYTPPFPLVEDLPAIRIWGEIGVIFLMFSLGLEFSFRKLAKLGTGAIVATLIEVPIVFGLGMMAGSALGWPKLESIYLGAAVSISSTTIIVKALGELKLRSRRFAEMVFGILVVEDLIAVILIVALSTFARSDTFSGLEALKALGKLILVIGGWFIVGYFLVPRLVRVASKHANEEQVTILSVALCFLLVVFASRFGYSPALGAFIMGSILAESTESRRIEERIEPLRDLFVAVFFVSIGMLMDPKVLIEQWPVVLLVCAIVVGGKILGASLGALVAGQSLRTAVQVGFGLAQIGEFSFIIVGLAAGPSERLYPIVVAASVLTTFTTPYLIRISHRAAVALESRLPGPVRGLLAWYETTWRRQSADVGTRAAFRRSMMRWGLNAILVAIIFIVTAETLLPIAAPVVGFEGVWLKAAGLVTALLFSAPFVWGMLAAFRKSATLPAELFFLTASLALLSLLSLEFFPARYVLLLLLALSLAAFSLFYRRIGSSYRWLEEHFLEAFKGTEAKTKSVRDLTRRLAPWDAHLVRLKIHPNAELAGKRLDESELRSRRGVNVVVIHRGKSSIVAPRPQERILPADELLVLGTDDQIESVRPEIEGARSVAEGETRIEDYELRQQRIPGGSELEGRTIRQCGIRERFGAMVVGIERADLRITNPDTDLQLKAEDRLWLVGAREQLDQLEASLSLPQ